MAEPTTARRGGATARLLGGPGSGRQRKEAGKTTPHTNGAPTPALLSLSLSLSLSLVGGPPPPPPAAYTSTEHSPADQLRLAGVPAQHQNSKLVHIL
jgi:hypothetical protein